MIRHALALLFALTLSGCAGLQRVDNTVQSFARWNQAGAATVATPTAPQSYRFERLLSQRDGPDSQEQDRLEAMARTALESRGWALAATDADARWTVQVTTRTTRIGRDPWRNPWDRWQFQGHIVAGSGHVFLSPFFVFPIHPPAYERHVTLLIRDVASARVVYETRAEHESPWNSTSALWQAMLEAALRDFPAPPSGPRQVNVELPR
jgi:hypothetical protein